MPQNARRAPRKVPLNRALSKLGILSRAQATEAIRAGRVHVDGRLALDPAASIEPERVSILVDGARPASRRWRTIVLNKPRGVLTTRRDPDGRRTVYDVLGHEARGLIAVGRLDLATSGLLILTNDTRLADWITNPVNRVPRVYLVTVRGRVDQATVAALTGVSRSMQPNRWRAGLTPFGAHAVTVTLRKASSRESHLVVELREGRNREIRRLFQAIGHEVTRLKRVSFGAVELGGLEPGRFRELSRDQVRAAFPGAPIRSTESRS